MNAFQSNISNIYGEKGKAWLDELPELVKSSAHCGCPKKVGAQRRRRRLLPAILQPEAQ